MNVWPKGDGYKVQLCEPPRVVWIVDTAGDFLRFLSGQDYSSHLPRKPTPGLRDKITEKKRTRAPRASTPKKPPGEKRSRGRAQWIVCRAPGHCAQCGTAIEAGQEAFYRPPRRGRSGHLFGSKCGHAGLASAGEL